MICRISGRFFKKGSYNLSKKDDVGAVELLLAEGIVVDHLGQLLLRQRLQEGDLTGGGRKKTMDEQEGGQKQARNNRNNEGTRAIKVASMRANEQQQGKQTNKRNKTKKDKSKRARGTRNNKEDESKREQNQARTATNVSENKKQEQHVAE